MSSLDVVVVTGSVVGSIALDSVVLLKLKVEGESDVGLVVVTEIVVANCSDVVVGDFSS